MQAERQCQLFEPDPDRAGVGNGIFTSALAATVQNWWNVHLKHDDKQTLLSNAADLVEEVRHNGCHIHSITNTVAQNFTANVLLAIGASVSMTANPNEMEAFVEKASALHVNLGTLDDTRIKAIRLAIKIATSRSIPVTIDPVMIHMSPIRKALALEIAPACQIVKANAAEYDLLNGNLTPDVCLISTGVEDVIQSAVVQLTILNGTPRLATTIATGCALGAVIAAFSAITEDVTLAALASLLLYSVSGEVAAEQSAGPGSFVPVFLDTLHTIEPSTLIKRAKVS